MKITDLPYNEPYTLPETATLEDVARELKEKAVGSMLVTDEHGKLTGIITDRDLVLRAIIGQSEPRRSRALKDYMTKDPVFVDAEDDVDSAVQRMRTRGVRRIPICTENKPVGMLALDDVLDLLTRSLRDLVIENQARRSRMLRAARVDRLRDELEDLYAAVHDRLLYAGTTTREALVAEVDTIKSALRRMLKLDDE